MPEAAGPANQSGISYQNSCAALFLGRLCDMRIRPAHERVIEVRVEAPSYVDDIVVMYADRHQTWIQAKENISKNEVAWKQLWRDMEHQCWSPEFQPDDRLKLMIGTRHDMPFKLRELCARAEAALNYQEWLHALTQPMVGLVENIRSFLSREHQNDEAVFSLLSHLSVEIITLDELEHDDVVRWMPPSNTDPGTLFRLLRDMVGGYARYRRTFRAPQLLATLSSDHHVTISEPHNSGLPAYRAAVVQAYAFLEVPGTSIKGTIDTLFVWPMLRQAQAESLRESIFEEEDPLYQRRQQPGTINLQQFPQTAMKRAIIVGGAGFGKSTLLRAIMHRLAKTQWLPALISLPELSESNDSIINFLERFVQQRFNVHISWDYYCDSGLAVLLFDGLDELAPRDRRRILTMLRDFSGRYEDVAWLLTVRDAAALSGPVDAPILSVDTFSHDQMMSLTAAYQSIGAAVSPEEVRAQLKRHPDLELLTRIPLFLALLLATTESVETLPHKRTDLLEHYLYILLRPEEHKPSIPFLSTSHELREVAEYLAFTALEKGKLGFNEREAAQILRDAPQGTGITSGTFIDLLSVCGLVRRSPRFVTFVFPIVQEYLAACYLVHHLGEQIAQRFELSVRRPWAQTLQFALEQHPKADQIITELLAKPDDAFNTVTRLIGRCIANGTRVSISTRIYVGDKLAEAWTEQSYTLREKIGNLLADAFTNPLPTRVRTLLEEGWGLNAGGAEIIVSCNDPDLTRSVVRSVLKRDLANVSLINWQSAIDKVANDALVYYLQRLELDGTTDKDVRQLTYFIQELSANYLPSDTYKSIIDNESLPEIIRLVGYFLGPRPFPEIVFSIADNIVHALPNEETSQVLGWSLALDTILNCTNPISRLQLYIFDDTLSEKRRKQILFYLFDHTPDKEEQLNKLLQLQEQKALPTELLHTILLLQAYLTKIDALAIVTNDLSNLSIDNLDLWIAVASRYRSKDTFFPGVSYLAQSVLEPELRVSLGGRLAFCLVWEVELASLTGLVGREGEIHPAAAECAQVIWKWATEHEGTRDGRIKLLLSASELGLEQAVEALRQEFIQLIEQNREYFNSRVDENLFSRALYLLKDRRYMLPLHILKQYVEVTESVAATAAIAMIAVYANEEALLMLLHLYEMKRTKHDWFVRDSSVPYIEELAGRLGVQIVREGEHLMRKA